MSCCNLVPPRASVAIPQPIADSCNELCTRQCPDSSAFIQPPPVVVTFPGPILNSFPQQAVVGSSGAPSFGGNLGLGGLYGSGSSLGLGGYGGSFGLGGYGGSLGLRGYGGSRGYGSSFGLGGYGSSLGYGGFRGCGGSFG
ncbi:KRSC protein, partial [Amazona guildingii]|nr:KRSC protein [Amazona guildingii]